MKTPVSNAYIIINAEDASEDVLARIQNRLSGFDLRTADSFQESGYWIWRSTLAEIAKMHVAVRFESKAQLSTIIAMCSEFGLDWLPARGFDNSELPMSFSEVSYYEVQKFVSKLAS